MKGKPTPPQLIPYLQNKKEKFHKAQKESLHLSPHSFFISILSPFPYNSSLNLPPPPSTPRVLHALMSLPLQPSKYGLFVFVVTRLQSTLSKKTSLIN